MKQYTSCHQAVTACMESQTFSIAHLHKEEKTMEMHVHECYELYYSISGGREFLIGNQLYTISPGDLFIINQYETHRITDIDVNTHERIVINFHPCFVRELSDTSTDLSECFSCHPDGYQHRIRLDKDTQKRFLYLVNKITSAEGFGSSIVERATVMELLVMLNILSANNSSDNAIPGGRFDRQVADILAYINKNISQQITIEKLAEYFFMSPSYLCRIFKNATGTTINRYITARRITIAKALLDSGVSVTLAYERSGFSDYSNFYKAFQKSVGMSPKKYAIMGNRM